jgi:Flp pilus assembly protein TadG
MAKVTRQVGRFGRAKAGNVAITFAMATLPVIGGVGAAVDYSRANAVKASLQDALDSTALMLSKEAVTDTSSALQTNALKYFKALYTPSNTNNVTISASYTTTGGAQVTVNGSVDVPTVFMGIMGFQKLTVKGSSTSAWGSTRLRVALVLDNTGSMADDGKMTALKSATKSLLNQLKSAASVNGDVYVSIVPFVKDVNVGSSNYNADWIDWTEWDADNTTTQTTTTCSGNSGHSGGSGHSHSNNCKTTTTSVPKDHNTWNGCVMDRGDTNGPDSGNYDTNVVAPTSAKKATLYTAEQYSLCPSAAVKPLSYDWSGMSSLINDMSSNGSTNQGIGLQLGWMSLVGGGPFPTPPAEEANYQYSHIVILLTDGLNTQNRWWGDGSRTGTSDDDKIDAREKTMCTNFKNASKNNILFTIQVNTGGDPTSTLLKDCASSSDKFWELKTSSAIAATFQEIGTNLTQLRVAK